MTEVTTLSLAYLAKRGVSTSAESTDDPSNPVLRGPGDQVYFLGNLLAKCTNAPRKAWRGIVAQHFDGLLSMASLTEPEGLTVDELRAQIRTRLLLDVGESDTVDLSYARPFAPGLVVVLCVDYPTTVRTINSSTVAKLSVDADELYRVGQANVDAEPIEGRAEIAPGVIALEGESLFVATKVLNMPRLIQDHLGSAPNGVVFAVPHRSLILAVAPTSVKSVESVNVIVQAANRFAEGGFGQLPGGIVSPGVFFWKDGDLQQIAGRPDQDALSVDASGAFLDMLNSLG